MKKLIFLVLLLIGFDLYSDSVEYASNREANKAWSCDLNSQIDNNTSFSLIGDSQGQFASTPLFGYYGWPKFLALSGEANWNMQNLAVGMWTTRSVYDRLIECSRDEFRPSFKTARRYVVEIGGNDLLKNFWIPLIMPWKLGYMSDWMVSNQRVILKLLKLQLQARNTETGNSIPNLNPGEHILFMSNLPIMAKGPISGSIENQLRRLSIMESFLESLKGLFLVSTQMTLDIIVNQFVNISNQISSVFRSSFHFEPANIIPTEKIVGHYTGNNPIILAYIYWISYMVFPNSSILTPVAMIQKDSQEKMKRMASEEGVHWLDGLYNQFVNQDDCLFGHCYVGDAVYISKYDPTHIHQNIYGYAKWGFILGKWLRDSGWYKPITDGNGKIYTPTVVSSSVWTEQNISNAGQIQDSPTITPEDNLLTLVLFCFFGGFCR